MQESMLAGEFQQGWLLYVFLFDFAFVYYVYSTFSFSTLQKLLSTLLYSTLRGWRINPY